MKNLISFIIFISLPMLYIGQNNLVVNCSFENYTIGCDDSNINFGGIRWGYCANWSSPDALSPIRLLKSLDKLQKIQEYYWLLMK